MTSSHKVIAGFTTRVNQTLDYHKELMLAVNGKRRQLSLETILVEQLLIKIAVMWEAFINDLLLAYAVEGHRTCLKKLEERVRKSLADRFGQAVTRRIDFKWPKSLVRAQALALIDPKGWNISANEAKALSDRANELLPASSAKKFFLSSDDRELLDLLLGVRNFLSHQSKRSREQIRILISKVNNVGSNAPLSGRFTTAGAYLKHDVGAGEMRAHFIVGRLVQIAVNLG